MSTFMRPNDKTPSTSISIAITATESGRRRARRTIHIIRSAEDRGYSRRRSLHITSEHISKNMAGRRARQVKIGERRITLGQCADASLADGANERGLRDWGGVQQAGGFVVAQHQVHVLD